MSSSEQTLGDVHFPPATSTPAPSWTKQSQGFSNSWSTTPSNKVFVFNAAATTAQTSSHNTQGATFSGLGNPGISSQQKLLSSLKSNNNPFQRNSPQRLPFGGPWRHHGQDVCRRPLLAVLGARRREEYYFERTTRRLKTIRLQYQRGEGISYSFTVLQEEESTTELVRTTTRKRQYPSRHSASFPYSRPAAPQPTFAQSFQASSFGRNQSQTTNPFSWGVPSEPNGHTTWFSGNNANNKVDHGRGLEPAAVPHLAPTQHRAATFHSQGYRNSCQCHQNQNDSEDMFMECEFCEAPPAKTPKHVQCGFASSVPQNICGSGPCHSSCNNRCQNTSAMMDQEAMDTETITQSSSRSHLPSTPCSSNCVNCAMHGSCHPALPPCQLTCGCQSKLAHHLRPNMQHGLHQSQVKKKVLFIEEINLDGPGPLPKCCSHLSRGCAGPTCTNDSPPAYSHGNSVPSFQHQTGIRNLHPDDCRPCGNRAFLEGQPCHSRGILKTQSMRRHSTIGLPCQQDCSEQTPASRCRFSTEKRTTECQSANSTFSREATFGFKRSVNFDARLPAEDQTKSSNEDSFDSGTGNQDVIFLKRQRTENR